MASPAVAQEDNKEEVQKPKHRVLIVDDDRVFTKALQRTLEGENIEVTTVGDAKNAQNIVLVENIKVVISDVNLPKVSGIELLHFIRRNKSEVPVILMTAFAEFKDPKEALDLGARAFLRKPFRRDELMSALKECLPDLDVHTTYEDTLQTNADLDYCKLSIDDFISGNQVQFDVYIRLSSQKYVKIAHKGEAISMDRLEKYKKKNIKHLYMKKEDFKEYMGFNVNLAPLVRASKGISKTKKLNFLKHTGEVIMEHLFLNDVDEEGFNNAKTVVEATSSLVSDSSDLFNLIHMLNDHSDYLYAHSLGVSLYGVMIAKAVKWNSPASVYKVAMGGLFHDIGKKEIDRSILEKSRRDYTPDEVKIYETHPYRGMEILSRLNAVPSDVLQIVLQHHENCLGLGFPMGLSKARIHPMARLIAVANEFCKLAVKGPDGPALAPEFAVRRMISLHTDKLDHMFFVALMQIFKIKPPSDFRMHHSV